MTSHLEAFDFPLRPLVVLDACGEFDRLRQCGLTPSQIAALQHVVRELDAQYDEAGTPQQAEAEHTWYFEHGAVVGFRVDGHDTWLNKSHRTSTEVH